MILLTLAGPGGILFYHQTMTQKQTLCLTKVRGLLHAFMHADECKRMSAAAYEMHAEANATADASACRNNSTIHLQETAAAATPSRGPMYCSVALKFF